MTEAQWLASGSPERMLGLFFLPDVLTAPKPSDRKLRLFCCACCRTFWDLLTDARSREGVLVAERFADGTATEDERRGADHSAYYVPSPSIGGIQRPRQLCAVQYALWPLAGGHKGAAYGAAALVSGWPERAARFADLLREILGNPFRTIARPTVSPDAGAIARAIYEDRDWALVGVLADALEESGCPAEQEAPCPTCSPYKDDPCPACEGKRDVARCPTCDDSGKFPPGYHPERDVASGRHEGGWTNCKTCNGGGNRNAVRPGVVRLIHPLLAHLRSAGPHVRGCWALDLVLGKD